MRTFLFSWALLSATVAIPDGISRVGSYQEYSGRHGSGGGYSGPSADHWMFHERQAPLGASQSRGSKPSAPTPSIPVRPNMTYASVAGAYVFTDRSSYVEFHEYTRNGPSGEFRLDGRHRCQITRQTTRANGQVGISSFNCSGDVAVLHCSISGDTVSCSVSRADRQHTGIPGQQTARLKLTQVGDYSAWIKTRIVAH